MRHQKTKNKLSRDSAHRKSLLMNLSKEIIEHERIETTQAKAKAVKPEIEKLITLAKRATCTLAARRSRRLRRTSSRCIGCSRRWLPATPIGPGATRAS